MGNALVQPGRVHASPTATKKPLLGAVRVEGPRAQGLGFRV